MKKIFNSIVKQPFFKRKKNDFKSKFEPADFLKSSVVKNKQQVESEAIFPAQSDPLILPTNYLIEEIKKLYVSSIDPKNLEENWADNFEKTLSFIENYLLIRSLDRRKHLINQFNHIIQQRVLYLDYHPGYHRRVYSRIKTSLKQLKRNSDSVIFLKYCTMEEKSFITELSDILNEADYKKVSTSTLQECLKKNFLCDYCEVIVASGDHLSLKIWTSGKLQKPQYSLNKKNESGTNSKKYFYQDVIVAAQNLQTDEILLNSFKDIAEDDFHCVIPTTRVRALPKHLKKIRIQSLAGVGLLSLSSLFVDEITLVALTTSIFAYTVHLFTKFSICKLSSRLQWRQMLYSKRIATSKSLLSKISYCLHDRTLKKLVLIYGTALRLSVKEKDFSEEKLFKEANETMKKMVKVSNPVNLNFQSEIQILVKVGVLHTVGNISNKKYSVVHPEIVADSNILRSIALF